MSDTLNSSVQEWETLVGLAHEIVHGGPNESVITDGGTVRSFAKLMADKDAEINVRYDGAIEQTETAALQATTAKKGAELARDAANIGGKVYPTAADGVVGGTGVAVGQFFNVRSASTTAYIDEYQNVAGVATPTGKSYPSTALLDFLKQAIGSGAMSWSDRNFVDALRLDEDGTFNIALAVVSELRTSKLLITTSATDGSILTLSDDTGNECFRVTKSGALESPTITALSKRVARIQPGMAPVPYELVGVVSYGQSKSVGFSSIPLISTAQPYGSLTLSGGVVTAGRSSIPSDTLVPLVETSVETPVSGICNSVNQVLATENGFDYTKAAFSLVGTAAGASGTAISGLVRGTTPYTNFLTSISAIYALALAANKPYACLAVTWMQGESDIGVTSRAAYSAALVTLQQNLQTDIQAITGQTEPVYLFTAQVSDDNWYASTTPNIALAQLDAAAANSRIIICGSTYHLQFNGTGLHLTPSASKQAGAMLGLAVKRTIFDGAPFVPLKPLAKKLQGKTATVSFAVPYGGLVFDESGVSNPGNYGFSLVDSGGSALTIASVSIVGVNAIKIVAAATIPAGAKVRYAYGNGKTSPLNTSAGRITGDRGCLRDMQGDSYVFDPLTPANLSGINKRMDNWCIRFEI